MTRAVAEGRPRLRGMHVLAIFVGFFLAVFIVDGIFIYQAVSTFGGIETPDAYKKGVAYNDTIAEDEQQARLGWTDEVSIVGAPHRLRVELHGRDGAVVARKRLVATIGRPATNRFDATLDLTETAAGIYEAALPVAAEGTWIVDLSAYDGSAPEPAYQARRRLWIGH